MNTSYPVIILGVELMLLPCVVLNSNTAKAWWELSFGL